MTTDVIQLVRMGAASAAGMLPSAPAGGEHAAHAIARAAQGPGWAALIPLLPVMGVVLVTLCAVFRVKNKLPAVLTLGCLGTAFGLTIALYLQMQQPGAAPVTVVKLFDWIHLAWTTMSGGGGGTASVPVAHALVADFAFYFDRLTLLWMLFVTGLGTVIALYSMEYMSHDVGPGYCRYFAAFNLFVFSMSCLVMGDNLLLLFLGWEGVGLCSYLLIGYYYKRPAAVAAAKKAFIVNRIGDLGLLMGVLSTYAVFGTVRYDELFAMISAGVDGSGRELASSWAVWGIPLMLTAGAFGKSAQLFFYVWLPDAMEGPTPVSALIHAATMVTAGVYLIARMMPLFAADHDLIALTFVAWSGAITALWAATIGMAIFDIKRVMGYSTISQLGFMFAGLGLLTTTGAAFHTFTHAFFKATLFLGVGAVMHGFGGQLDLRRLSGVMKVSGFGLIGLAMLVGSLNLAGFPFTAGFFSKDMILAQGWTTPREMIPGADLVGWVLLITAGLTAYYTFRAFFRVFTGPKQFVPGDDPELVDLGRHPKGTTLEAHHAAHGHGHGHGHDDHGHGHEHVSKPFDPKTEDFTPHAPGWAIKAAVGLVMLLSIAAAGLYFVKGEPGTEHGGWVGGMVHRSSAALAAPEWGGVQTVRGEKVGSGNFFGQDPHAVMYYVSAGVGLLGILAAALLHGPRGAGGLFLGNRDSTEAPRAAGLARGLGVISTAARNKWYVDEIYNALIRIPLLVAGHLFHALDRGVVDGTVNLLGRAPKGLGESAQKTQVGVLNSYAYLMAAGIAIIAVVALFMVN